jgi:hypothetical protein
MGRAQAAGSVMPHSSINGHPNAASTSRIFASGMVCPPTVQRVKLDTS